ncbi:MAG TPA: hypothetical protein VL326_32065 [Kofleriaceae bacterium]|jgi:hypothetical protein|nr:hypothetical protein [Kofleriaceae bacterium]
MSLGDLFAAHLRAPSHNARELVAALAGAGLEHEASAVDAWCSAKHEIASRGAWFGKHVPVSAVPPATAAAGDLWFDICELALMVCTGRDWLATRPMARWQMHGFLEAAPRVPREVQVKPPYRALDPARLLQGDELGRCTMLTAGEATLYAWWFGKSLPHLFDWQAAAEALPGTAMRELWLTSNKEWTSTKLDTDEAARIFVTPSTIDWDPDEVLDSELELPETKRAMIRGELTRERDIGARTSVLLQTGLHSRVTVWATIAEDVRLAALLDRSQFR